LISVFVGDDSDAAAAAADAAAAAVVVVVVVVETGLVDTLSTRASLVSLLVDSGLR